MAEPIEVPFGGSDLCGPRNHTLDGVDIPHGKRPFFLLGEGVVRHNERQWVSAAVYAAKRIIQSSITARHAMRLLVKTIWPLIVIVIVISSTVNQT